MRTVVAFLALVSLEAEAHWPTTAPSALANAFSSWPARSRVASQPFWPYSSQAAPYSSQGFWPYRSYSSQAAPYSSQGFYSSQAAPLAAPYSSQGYGSRFGNWPGNGFPYPPTLASRSYGSNYGTFMNSPTQMYSFGNDAGRSTSVQSLDTRSTQKDFGMGNQAGAFTSGATGVGNNIDAFAQISALIANIGQSKQKAERSESHVDASRDPNRSAQAFEQPDNAHYELPYDGQVRKDNVNMGESNKAVGGFTDGVGALNAITANADIHALIAGILQNRQSAKSSTSDVTAAR